MRIYFLVLFILSSVFTRGQDKGQNNIEICAGTQYYFNKSGLNGTDGREQTLFVQNTTGYNIGVRYERVTKYNLTFTGGIFYGTQSQKITGKYLYATVVPERQYINYTQLQWENTYAYLSYQLLAGYNIALDKHNKFELKVKGGLEAFSFFKGDIIENTTAGVIQSIEKDGSDNYNIITGDTFFGSLGNGNERTRRKMVVNPLKNRYMPCYSWYIGVKYNKGLFNRSKGIELGIRGTYFTLGDKANSNYVISRALTQPGGQGIINQTYYNRLFSVGLQASVNL